MTKEPNEKWLDRHFAQQLEEYEPVFQQEASASDQELITYWLQIFLAAPKPQKWARNSLMLLMYGHLKEIGYLQVPFTDVNSMGKNLNKVLDGYTGLPVVTTNRTRSTHVLTPIAGEQTPSQTDVQTSSPFETDRYTALPSVSTSRTYSKHVLTPIPEEKTPSPPETDGETSTPPETDRYTALPSVYTSRTYSKLVLTPIPEKKTPSPPETDGETSTPPETYRYTALPSVSTSRTYSKHVLTPIPEEQTPSPPEIDGETSTLPETDRYTALPSVSTSRTYSKHVLTPIPEEQTPSPPGETSTPPETDRYTALPSVSTSRTYSKHVLTPILEKQTPSPPETDGETLSPPETEASTPYPPETEVQTPSQLETEESTTAKEDIYSNRTASIKRQLSYRSSLEEATLGRESTRSSASSHQTLYDTFDSHECYQSATERLLCMAESGRMLQVEAVVESMRRLDGPPLSTISEESISKVNDRALQKSCSKLYKEIIKAKGGNFEQMQDVDSTSSRASSEATEKRVASAAARRKVTALIEPTRRHSPESSPGQTTRRDNEAELTYLRRRNKQLRRECLIYYHRNGKLRKYPKYPKIDAQALGFQVAAYRAHARLARWQVLSGVPQYFHQEYDRKNGWRTYRRILLATAVPRSVLRRPVTPRRARPRVPLRLSDILPLKHIYTEMGASRMCYGHGIWAQNITLADHMQCNPRTSVE